MTRQLTLERGVGTSLSGEQWPAPSLLCALSKEVSSPFGTRCPSGPLQAVSFPWQSSSVLKVLPKARGLWHRTEQMADRLGPKAGKEVVHARTD